MSQKGDRSDRRTAPKLDRRTLLKYAGLVSTGTIFAGCVGNQPTDGGDGDGGDGDGGDGDGGDGDGGTDGGDGDGGDGDGGDGDGGDGDGDGGDPSGTDFVYATTITPATIDPMKASDNLETITVHNVYDPLLYYTDDTPPELIPWLAKDWEVANDKRTYTLPLREDAQFHNGDPVTADDVVYSVKRMLNMQRGFSWMWSGVLKPGNVQKVDEYTVEMKTENVYAPFVFTLPYMFVVNQDQVEANAESEGDFGEHGDYGTAWLESNDAGGGPYKLTNRQRKQRMVLEKNEDWWGNFAEGNTYEKVNIEMVQEQATVVGMMKNQQADLSDQWLSLQAFNELAQNQNLAVSAKATFNPFYIFMHNQREPLNDVNVRKAISHAFDYQTALNDVMAGESEQLKGPLPSAMWGHKEDVKVYSHDMDKAQQFLDQSDYSAEDIDLTYTYVTGLTVEQNMGLLLQTNLNELGVNLEVQKAPWSNITSMVTKKENTPDMLAIYLGFSYADPDTFLYPAWHSSSHGSWQSAAWYQNSEVDQLLDDARRVLDQDERASMYREAQQLIAEDAPAIFVMNQATRYSLNKRVNGFRDNGVMGYTHTFHRFTEQS